MPCLRSGIHVAPLCCVKPTPTPKRRDFIPTPKCSLLKGWVNSIPTMTLAGRRIFPLRRPTPIINGVLLVALAMPRS